MQTVKSLDDKTEIVSINKIVTNLVKFFECEAIIKNVQLTTYIEEEQIFVMMKENEMKQVLINLVKNAIEAIEICEDRMDVLKLEQKLSINMGIFTSLIMVVECLMKPKTSCLHLSIQRKQTGTGIGLSVCKKIIENHKGHIYITTVKDKGTKFTIELPIFNKNYDFTRKLYI